MTGTFRNPMYKELAAAFGIFLFFGLLYTALGIYIGDTNFGTANGLWKWHFVQQYMENPASIDYCHPEELSFYTNLYYFPVYAKLLQWPPLAKAGLLPIAKLTAINAWFGALALAAFFLLMLGFKVKPAAAGIATLFHAACGMMLSVCTNSEDIIPSYACFAVSLLFWAKYLQSGLAKHLLPAAMAYAAMWLFHWTMLFAPLPAFGITLLLKAKTPKRIMLHSAMFALTVLTIVMGSAWYFGAPPEKLLYPAKSMNGWLGFAASKWALLFTGFSQYVAGGFQFNGLAQLSHYFDTDRHYRFVFAASLIFMSGMAAYGLRRLLGTAQTGAKLAGLFLLVNFLVGELMNVYEFGTDLQFHLQPMIWLPVAFGFFVNASASKNRLAFPMAAGLSAALLAYNVIHYRLPNKGGDAFQAAELRKVLDSLRPDENTYFITRGWDTFRNWMFAMQGDNFKNNAIAIVDFPEMQPGESVEAAKNRLEAVIAGQLQRGNAVIAGPDVVDEPMEVLVDRFSGFQQNEKVEVLAETVRNRFGREKVARSALGNFYKLHRKPGMDYAFFPDYKMPAAQRLFWKLGLAKPSNLPEVFAVFGPPGQYSNTGWRAVVAAVHVKAQGAVAPGHPKMDELDAFFAQSFPGFGKAFHQYLELPEPDEFLDEMLQWADAQPEGIKAAETYYANAYHKNGR